MYPEVKFPRDIVQGCIGDDVIAHKRAISRWNPKVYPWQEFSNYAGPIFMNAIVKFKVQHELSNDEKLGSVAHTALEKTHKHDSTIEYAFDAYAIKLAQDYYDKVTITPEERIRNAIVAAAFFWYSKRYHIYYSQARPFQMGKPTWYPSRWDCSAFATNCHYAGGAPDPNGLGYNHEGYTGTLMDHGTRVSSVSDLSKGDLIFYGYSSSKPGFRSGDPTHVAVYVGVYFDKHMIVSNGSYPMRFVPYNYRSDLNHFRHYEIGV